MIRTDSQCGRILRVLSDGRPHTVPDIHRKAGTSRLNSRVADLRRHGYVITCERVAGRKGASAYRYQLVDHPETLVNPGPLVALVSEPEPDSPGIEGDAHAPRDAANRFRLYRLTGGDTLQLVATAPNAESLGLAIVTLGAEQEWERCAFGLLDTNGTDAKPGTWLISPYDAKATL